MKTPRELRAADRQGITVRKHDYEDETVIAVDFGDDPDELTVDVVDNTAIVVVDGQQLEFDVPAEASEVTVNDGILTIEE